MHKRRVVITGMGAVSPFGWGMSELDKGLMEGSCSIGLLDASDAVGGMLVTVGGKAPAFNEKSIPREYRRSMSRSSIMAFAAASEALRMAGIEPSTPVESSYQHMGSSIASTTVSPNTLEDFFKLFLQEKSVENVRSTVFFKIMGHAAPSNINAAFGLAGRCVSPAAACASSLQATGLAYEYIAFGRSEIMLCGGVEEFHSLLPATFDRIGAASQVADPDKATSPFDINRSGIVCSEGAGIYVLESLEHATKRGATILAEVVGFGTNTSPKSIVFPDQEAIEDCMNLALQDASLTGADINLVNAHATATEAGDIAEGKAIEAVIGSNAFVNSLKGYMGHCMAASGAIELAAVINGGRAGLVHGTRNLEQADPRCGKLNLAAKHREGKVQYVLKNSFGLGGVNSSLIIKI